MLKKKKMMTKYTTAADAVLTGNQPFSLWSHLFLAHYLNADSLNYNVKNLD